MAMHATTAGSPALDEVGSAEDIVYEEENSLRSVLSGGSMTSSGRRIKAATLAKLVDLIAHNQVPPAQPHLEADLVLSYAMFCSSQEFVDTLLSQYNQMDEYDFVPRRKLANLLRLLMHQLLADNPHSKAVSKIQRFAEENRGEEFASQFLDHLGVRGLRGSPDNGGKRDASAGASRGTTSTIWVGPHEWSASPVLLVDPLTPITRLGQVAPQELARQITLLQAQAFQKLRTCEYSYWMRARLSMHDVVYRHRLRDPVHRRKMGNLLDVIAKFCGTVHWLRRELAQSADVSATLRYLFDFARELLRANNLQGLAAVVLVLADHFPALRAMLTSDELKELNDIVRLFHSSLSDYHDDDVLSQLEGIGGGAPAFHFSHSTRSHRDILFNAQSSVLPFIMPYLDGLQIIIHHNNSFIGEDGDGSNGGETPVKNKVMVSLQKMERASLVLRLVQQYQHRTYAFEPVANIQAFIEQRLQEGLQSMALRPLRDLCRQVVWVHRVDYRPHHLPQELNQFLDRSHLPMGDVLDVLNHL